MIVTPSFNLVSLHHLPIDLHPPIGEVHVWMSTLDLPDDAVQQLAQVLSTDECIRAKRFAFESHRQRFIVGRGILRYVLASYLAVAPRQIEFAYQERGKPVLATSLLQSYPIAFNLSHSHHLAIYGVSRTGAIGIDIEQLRPLPNVLQLANRFFSPNEHDLIRSLPPAQQQSFFFRLWTCKEAYLKATGEGLMGLKQVEVCLDRQGDEATVRRVGDQTTLQNPKWTIAQFCPSSEFMAALAIEGHVEQITYYQITPGAIA